MNEREAALVSGACRAARALRFLGIVSAALTYFAFMRFASAEVLSAAEYVRHKDNKGVVIVSVDWFRNVPCGPYRSAQLNRLEFGLGENRKTVPLSFVIERPSTRRFRKLQLVDYGFLVDPGQYAVIGYEMLVNVRSGETNLVAQSNKRRTIRSPAKETVNVAGGDILYVGSISIDCEQQATIKHHSLGSEAMDAYREGIANMYPFLDASALRFRTFTPQ